MDIFDVATHFDDTPVADGYSLAPLYLGQFASFLEASPDGNTSQRRTMSLAPGLMIPARRVVRAQDETHLVGYGTVDTFFGATIRQAFWLKRATGLFTIRTPGQAALNTGGTTAYAHMDYLKDTVNSNTDSEYDPFWDIYFAPAEGVQKGTLLEYMGTLYRVRSTHRGIEDLVDAATDELDAGARVSVSFTSTGAYDPVTDTMAAGTTATTGILLDRYMYYELRTQADQLMKAGDKTLIVAASAVTPVVGKPVTIAGEPWRIEQVTPEQDAYALHVRRA